jgi:peroxiredoxin Q/BCP
MFAGRVTFVVEKGGTIRMAFESQIRIGKHINDALATVRQLEKRAS